MKKTKELREMTRAEVEQKLKEETEANFNLKLRRNTQQIPNPLQLRHTRRSVARMKTVLNEDLKSIRKLAAGAGSKE
ncbi:MAG: 50S ribosomal protein L29 [Candidatus Edwardsbacteria bacterium RIFOXYD12_FULL_50_11]|jgi:large subunit ribosomal protein L29|uniref:Large ribosomal subunit protein uL29 n=1 Tax=Candidatus Edwardsbacteria bacterium GWF2_54_11 TaxID=1817851 RepID=A0A1F5RIJ5_9BACT|nr:50S ribosomal protein L29 [Candidatus Edwardsbacteria bacterium]OGF04629.1 MAG: 50S ribosomal protein L29 [Candidatus Edwardsbacteria bacterium RifOxyC12_full_54_24]OGF06018.1 MAG: 50S ribosomal protein L29 [Candidatus Edwardsbacteria bacterium RifOxyA12_full_54_48]OGF14250.1 MAG: 50S ribosomal protein L29 [Candidatus Edwardsbacteria bacterium GWF2_54_11]OGF16554.1 MAG: 50S ribosomal protein L29 [Candidatus Edwardsbacteria bacterium RIFOXYD12_FULL_50_11]OGJ18258.1 MAG: 50S ribosomal protein